MKLSTSIYLIPCLMLVACTGCTSMDSVTRGQSPGEAGSVTQVSGEWERTYHSTEGYPSYPVDHQAERQARQAARGRIVDGWGAGQCPDGNCQTGNCQTGTCQHGHRGGCPQCGEGAVKWAPRHYFSYAYNQPTDLSYPSPMQPAGAIDYPYYIFKGPSDFFRTK
ncbi:MAG: hypothetical protein R3C01_15005 [Planctomycetaceae bacterium]